MNNNELMHYGVLGMKWGVRKDKYRKARTIKKGTTMYRATVNKDEDTKGPKYVTYLKVDRDNYRGSGGDWLKYKSGNMNAKLYENSYKLTKDIKVASREELKTTFEKLAKQKNNERLVGKAFVEKSVNSPTSEAFRKKFESGYETGKYQKPSDVPGFKKMLEKSRKEALNDYLLNSKKKQDEEGDTSRFYAQAWAVGASDEFRKQVISELKKQGFNAMVDEASVGGKGKYKIEGVDPLIIFDSEDTLKKKKTKEVSRYDQDQAKRRFNEWSNTTNYVLGYDPKTRSYYPKSRRYYGKDSWKW